MTTTNTLVQTYEQAATYIREIGILPLASCIPEYPSLESVTEKTHWYTGTELDPWGWRNLFAIEGVAAYGKFLKKKAFFISADLFPAVRMVLGDERTVEKRYEAGLLSKSAVKIYEAILANPGIDTRALRPLVDMKDKDAKKDYDKALQELQESADIVIAGFVQKTNEAGEKSGWNSTSYVPSEHWMTEKGISGSLDVEQAKQLVLEHLERTCTEKALKAFKKAMNL